MRNFFLSLRFFTVVLAVFFSIGLYSQTTMLDYKQKGHGFLTTKIYFSAQNGASSITPEEFSEYENVFFTLIPATPDGKNYFKEGELKDDLGLIKFKQGNVDIQLTEPLKPVLNPEGKIEKVIISFSKKSVKLYVPFAFVSPVDTAVIADLSDEYYTYYKKYNEIYVNGLNLSDSKDYIKAFNVLMVILTDASAYEEISHYDFYKHATETLIENSIEQLTDSLTNVFEAYSKMFNKDLLLTTLKKCDSTIKVIHETVNAFAPYIKGDYKNSRIYRDKFSKLFDDMDARMFKNYETYNKSKMLFLETKNYNNYQFSLFVDVLAQMITHLDTLRLLKGIRPLDMAVLSKIPEKKKELTTTGWLNEFELLVGVLNQNIKNTGRVLSDSAMSNLQLQLPEQRQPYYEIFLAFNNLEQHESLFRDYLKTAIERCTDIVLIKNMEMWILSYKLTDESIDQQIVSQINEGIRLIDAKDWSQATGLFDVITRQASNVAPPWYYSGVIKFENQETFSAETMFDMALKLYPKYIAPRVYSMNSFFNRGMYDNLLKKSDEAIASYDIWYFHFWKARALYELKNYKQTIIELNDFCIVRNPWNVNQYFVLGDAYMELKDFTNAEIAYRKTQEINPFMDSQLFNEKMTLLQSKRKP